MTKVQDIVTKNVITCEPDTSVQEAARLMYLNGLTGLPVLGNNGEIVGIITEADMVSKQEKVHIPSMFGILGSLVYLDNPADGDEIEKQLQKITATQVKELMTKEVVTVDADAPLEDLAELMIHKKANPVPVIQDGKLVGIVSRADIVKLLAGDEKFLKSEWKDLMLP